MKRYLIAILKIIGLLEFAKKFYRSVNFTYVRKVNGKKFKLLKLYGANATTSELWMSNLLNSLFQIKKGAFVDIGMNNGQTLLTVKSLDSDREYIGFEPNPSCNMYVEELVRINRIQHCKLIPVGLFNENSLLELDLYADDLTNSGGSLIKDYWSYNNLKPHRKVIVPVMTYKTVSESLKIMDFEIVKIDVEGSELEVLQVLKDELKAFKPVIIIEILSAYSHENHVRINQQEEIIKIVNELSYKMWRIIEDKNGSIDWLQPIEFFDPLFDHNMCNYLFFHSSDESIMKNTFKEFIK